MSRVGSSVRARRRHCVPCSHCDHIERRCQICEAGVDERATIDDMRRPPTPDVLRRAVETAVAGEDDVIAAHVFGSAAHGAWGRCRCRRNSSAVTRLMRAATCSRSAWCSTRATAPRAFTGKTFPEARWPLHRVRPPRRRALERGRQAIELGRRWQAVHVSGVADAVPLLALASASWTLPTVNAYPLFVEPIPRSSRGLLTALFLLCMALGGAVGDPLNGSLFDLFGGYRPLFIMMAGYMVLAWMACDVGSS